MNVTEYIASGILESYVMGAVSDQERREVECLSSIYPDVRQELDHLSVALEQYTQLYSVEPPASVKAKLLAQLDFDQPQETVVRPMPRRSYDRTNIYVPTHLDGGRVHRPVSFIVFLLFTFSVTDESKYIGIGSNVK